MQREEQLVFEFMHEQKEESEKSARWRRELEYLNSHKQVFADAINTYR
jgi:hypothetical protein